MARYLRRSVSAIHMQVEIRIERGLLPANSLRCRGDFVRPVDFLSCRLVQNESGQDWGSCLIEGKSPPQRLQDPWLGKGHATHTSYHHSPGLYADGTLLLRTAILWELQHYGREKLGFWSDFWYYCLVCGDHWSCTSWNRYVTALGSTFLPAPTLTIYYVITCLVEG